MVTILAASAALLSVFALAKQQPDSVDKTPCIIVTGSSEVRMAPDLATLSVGVTAEAKTAQQAQNDANTRATDFLSKVKTLIGTKGTVQTGSLNLYPVYSQPTGMGNQPFTPQITGYRADNTLSVRLTDFALVGPVIDTAVASGLNNVQSVSFGLQDDSNARMQALGDAVKQARKKAEAIAAAAGVKVAGVWQIDEQGADVRPPMPQAMFARGMADSSVATPVEPGSVVVNGTVTIKFFVAEP